MYKILKILFLFTFLFISCDIHKSHFNESWFEVKETTNVKDFRYKNQALICVIEEDNGSILFKNNDVFHFSSIKEKTSVQFNNLEIILIPEKPFCIITYDDAPASDYDIYMIHKLYTPTVPAEIGIILSGFGLDKERLLEMCIDDNWEVVHHSYSHTRFERLRLQKEYKKGENKIYGWFVHTFMDNNEIMIDDDIYIIQSHSSDNQGQYFVIEPNLIRDYSNLSMIQLSDSQLKKEFTENLKNFENETNIKINHFTWPYTVSDKRSQSFVSEFFSSARAYNGLNTDGTNNIYDGGLNFYPFENRFTLNSANYIQYYSEDEILKMIAKAKDNKAVMIQFAHTWDSNFSTSKLIFFIDNLKKAGIDIITRSTLFDYYELWEK